MNRFVAAADDGEDVVPFTFDVGAVCVELIREAGVADHFLTRDDVFREGYSDTDGDKAKIDEDFHSDSGLKGRHSMSV